jgi:hypothetical protein
VANMVWQILSITTAQKFLSDIQYALVDIQKSLTAIHEFLEAGESAQLQESSRYASGIVQTLDVGDLAGSERDAVISHLERLDQDCAVIIRRRLQLLQDSEPYQDGTLTTGWVAAIERGLDQGIRFIDKQADQFKLQGPARQFETELAEFEHHTRTLFLAIGVRSLLIHLRTLLCLSLSRSKSKSAELRDTLKEYSQIHTRFFAQKNGDVERIGTKRDWSGAKDETKYRMSELLATIGNSLSAAQSDVDRLMRRVEQQQNIVETELRHGTQLFVSLNHSGTIEGVFREATDPTGKHLARATHVGAR